MNHKTPYPKYGHDPAWVNMSKAMTDYNNERHWTSLQLWAVIFFVTVFGVLILAGANGWLR